MQVCTSLQTDNHASTTPLFFTGRMPFLPPNQQHQSTEGIRGLLRGQRELILTTAIAMVYGLNENAVDQCKSCTMQTRDFIFLICWRMLPQYASNWNTFISLYSYYLQQCASISNMYKHNKLSPPGGKTICPRPMAVWLAVDLCPSADRSAVSTPLVAGGG